MSALADIVRQGKAIYAGISSYDGEQTRRASEIMKGLGVPLLIHQPSYSILNRWIEPELQGILKEEGIGSIAFCPLAQGLLTSKYLTEIPEDSRAAGQNATLSKNQITDGVRDKLSRLNRIAENRGQTLAQMSLAWALRDEKVTSALIGASRISQIEENVGALERLDFTEQELAAIDEIAAE